MRRPYRPYRGPRRLRRTSGVVLCALCAVVAPPLASEPSAAVRAPERMPKVTSEVFRLAEEEGRTRQRYERVLRAAKEQRARAEVLEELLRGRDVVTATLLEDAGTAARAQYRTGGFTARGSAEVADDPLELLAVQAPAVHRRARLGRMLDQNGRTSRRLAVESRSLAASRPALDKERARLRAAERSVERRLEEAREELDAMAEAAIGSGHCAPVEPPPVTEPAPTAENDARAPLEWVRPVTSYQLSAGFGGTGTSWANGHTGQDFAVPIGTPVRAVGAGTVVSVGCGGPFGISLVVQHEGGWYSQYAHLSALLAAPGTQVRAGQWIGLSGTTGNSTGPHLHFEIRTRPEYGSAVDPVAWLKARGVRL
ncbi:M23 family metallopeptidase [Streptomyces sp. ISL-11]|uniref:M23 family metallopeptidase n=1 Tax=Streptomyces sp. ISL-11 TaxID=2819174 RepID=UPI001BE6F412|nr:M23 family metallopeptidase [Streptomyces sp. ISL-11]MBT2382829.1 M23 family metallopeptidase [Streptomyces sp. ISL-11]